MTRIDPLVVIERMAERLRSQGAAHPVAGAIAVAARGHTRMSQSAFAECAGLPIHLVQSSESGDIPFGKLPGPVAERISALGVDLLALADLEATWRAEPPASAARP